MHHKLNSAVTRMDFITFHFETGCPIVKQHAVVGILPILLAICYVCYVNYNEFQGCFPQVWNRKIIHIEMNINRKLILIHKKCNLLILCYILWF
jgi:hypothetical protein